jgi:hypothetical protein
LLKQPADTSGVNIGSSGFLVGGQSSLQKSKHLDRGERRGSAEEREGFPERQAIRIRRVVPRVVGAIVVVIG